MPKITLAWPWTGVTEKGEVERTHKAGTTVNVDADTARDLVRRGLARKADDKGEAPAAPVQGAQRAEAKGAKGAGKES